MFDFFKTRNLPYSIEDVKNLLKHARFVLNQTLGSVFSPSSPNQCHSTLSMTPHRFKGALNFEVKQSEYFLY